MPDAPYVMTLDDHEYVTLCQLRKTCLEAHIQERAIKIGEGDHKGWYISASIAALRSLAKKGDAKKTDHPTKKLVNVYTITDQGGARLQAIFDEMKKQVDEGKESK